MNLNFPLSFCGKFIDLVKEFRFFSANICKIYHETMWSFVMKIQSFSDAWESWKFCNKTHAHTHKIPWIDTLECGVWPTLKAKILPLNLNFQYLKCVCVCGCAVFEIFIVSKSHFCQCFRQLKQFLYEKKLQ